jgi:hypothetical protein
MRSAARVQIRRKPAAIAKVSVEAREDRPAVVHAYTMRYRP